MYLVCNIYVQNFSCALPCTRMPRVGDEMPGSMTRAGGYYAGGANVATKACGRERQRGRWGNINGRIKWWWQQKMATRSNTVLMDLFAVCGAEWGDREMVCHWKSVYDILSPLCHHSVCRVSLTWDLLNVIAYWPYFMHQGWYLSWWFTDTWFFRDYIFYI